MSRTKKPTTVKGHGITPAEFREAERGFKLMLAKKFSAVWIAENATDLLAQANIEYAEWLETNPRARKPVGWILTCAYRRALNLLDTESRKPRPAPLDSLFHLPDESTPTPEQVALDNDRQRRLREAVSHLPEKEAMLLALIYFEDHSVREAGRKVGWRKSAADRHHKWALEKMYALVGDPKLLSPATLGPAAWAAVHGDDERALSALSHAAARPLREGFAIGSEVAELAAHRLGELARRLTPLSEPTNAAATGGAGRVVAQCGTVAGIAVCGFLAAPALQHGLDTFLHPSSPTSRAKSPAIKSRPARQIVTPTRRPASPTPSTHDQPTHTTTTERAQREQRARASSIPPHATGTQGGNEFGDNNFEPGSSEAEQPTESAPAPAPPPRADHGAAPSSSPEFGL